MLPGTLITWDDASLLSPSRGASRIPALRRNLAAELGKVALRALVAPNEPREVVIAQSVAAF